VHRPAATAGDQATIGKGLLVKGEITGTESLVVDGKDGAFFKGGIDIKKTEVKPAAAPPAAPVEAPKPIQA
jgi:hypothetical protein